MITILQIIGGIIVLVLIVQVLGRLARFEWFVLLFTFIVGLGVGFYYHSVWGGIGAGAAALGVLGILKSFID